jgi:hypothetical protein
MTDSAGNDRDIAAARPVDHASLMETSRTRLAVSRRLCRSTAEIIHETHVTIERALEKLDTQPDLDVLEKLRK